MAGGTGWSKNGIGKSRRSRNRASTPSRFFRCCKIHFAGFSEKRPSRVLPTMTEMTVMLLPLTVRRRKISRPNQYQKATCTNLYTCATGPQEGTELIPEQTEMTVHLPHSATEDCHDLK